MIREGWNIINGLIKGIYAGKARTGAPLLTPSIWRSRARLMDCDINLHLNNARYFRYMELARWHFSSYNGVLALAFKKNWKFIIGSQMIHYFLPIKPLHVFEIHTRVVYYDEKWMYLLEQFINPYKNYVYAECIIKSAVVSETGKAINPINVFHALGIDNYPKMDKIPMVINDYIEADQSMRHDLRTLLIPKDEKQKLPSLPSYLAAVNNPFEKQYMINTRKEIMQED